MQTHFFTHPPAAIRHGSLSVPSAANRDYDAAKRYLSQDSVERRLFERLEGARDRHFFLRIDHRNDDRFDPNTDTIWWDPTSALTTTRGGRQSPALGLGHEIDHADEPAGREDRLNNEADPRYDTREERRVITGSETHAARTLREGVRHDHAGTCYRVAGPTRLRPSTGA